VSEDVAPDGLLLVLDQFDVGLHSFRFEPLCEFS
jgi:hypothetical protein